MSRDRNGPDRNGSDRNGQTEKSCSGRAHCLATKTGTCKECIPLSLSRVDGLPQKHHDVENQGHTCAGSLLVVTNEL